MFSKAQMLAMSKSMAHLDFSDKVAGVACPTLVICGQKDSPNLKASFYLKDHIEGAKMIIINRAGHAVNDDNPTDLAEALNAFYQDTP